MKYVLIGKLVNTHGLKGEVKILSDFKYKSKVFIPGMKIYIGKEKQEEEIVTYRHHKIFEMITIKGYDNIDPVLKYKGDYVFVNKDDSKLSENEYLDEDLVGLNVIIDNKIIGIIKRVEYYPKQSLFVVKTSEKDCLIPYVSDIIEEVNLSEGFIRFKDIKGLI